MNFASRTAVKRQLWQLGHVSEQLGDRRLPALPCPVNGREVGAGAGLAGKGDGPLNGAGEGRARTVLSRPREAVGPADETMMLPVGIRRRMQAAREVGAQE